MRRNNQAGFSAVEALIIIVVVALLGLAGWYVYHKNKSDKTTPVSSSKQSLASSGSTKSDTANSKVKDFSFSYPTSWTVAANARTDEALTIKSPGEQENSGTPTSGASVDVYAKAIDSSWFGGSLSDYMKNYGSETPTSTTVAGYSALKIDTGSVVAVAFTKDNYVYGVEEYYPSGSANPYPTIVDDIAASFKTAN